MKTARRKTARRMKEVTVRVPDKKVAFFMELVKELGIEVSDEVEIPEEHKAIVLERMKKAKKNPERLLDWDKVRDSFKFD